MKKLTLSWDKADGASVYIVSVMKNGKWKRLSAD